MMSVNALSYFNFTTRTLVQDQILRMPREGYAIATLQNSLIIGGGAYNDEDGGYIEHGGFFFDNLINLQ